MGGIRYRFIDTGHIAAVEDDARRTSINKPRDAMVTTGSQHVGGAEDVGAVIIAITAADAGFRRDVKDYVAARRGARNRDGVGDVAPMLRHTEGIQLGVAAA